MAWAVLADVALSLKVAVNDSLMLLGEQAKLQGFREEKNSIFSFVEMEMVVFGIAFRLSDLTGRA